MTLLNFVRSTVVFLAPISRLRTACQFDFQECANYQTCYPGGTWRLLMYIQLLCCSSVNPWYIVEVGAGTGEGGTCGGAGVPVGAGAGVLGTAGAASIPVVGFAAGGGIGRDGGAAATRSATWRAMMSSAVSTTLSASMSTLSEKDSAADAGVSGAGSLPFLDASRGGLGGGCGGLLAGG